VASPWVNREIEHWLTGHGADRVIVVLTEGTLGWSREAGDFDWTRTDCLPRALSRAFADEPRYVDLRWAHAHQHLSARDPRFRDAVADIAVPLHGRPKDELVGEDVRQHRRTRLIARSAGAALAALAVAATALALVAVDQRNEARAQRDRAEREARIANSRRLAGEAVRDLDQQLDLGVLEALLARRLEPTLEARGAVATAVARTSRLRGVLRGHDDQVESVAVSPDGGLIASAGADDRVRLWDARTLRPVGAPHPCFCFEVRGVGFTPDGRRLVYPQGFDATEVTFLDPARGRRAGATLVDDDQVTGIAMDPLGRWLVTYGEDRPLRVFDLRTHHALRTLRVAGGRPVAVAVSRRGLLAVGGEEGQIELWDVRAGLRVGVLRGHESGWVSGLAFDRAGRALVSGGEDGRILVWDVRRQWRSGRAIVEDGWVDDVALSPDGRLIASAGEDGRVRVYIRARRSLVGAPLDGHEAVRASEASVSSVAFSPDGRTVVSGGKDGKVRVWRVEPRPLARLVPLAPVTGVAFERRGGTLAARLAERASPSGGSIARPSARACCAAGAATPPASP
jgi:WD40 repeat protein